MFSSNFIEILVLQLDKRVRFMHARKLKFYAKNVIFDLVPSSIFEKRYDRMFTNLDEHQWNYIRKRADYYNKLERRFVLDETASRSGAVPLRGNPSAYYYDLKEISRYFPRSLKFKYVFTDIKETVDEPTLLKTRPLTAANENSVILKLDKIRHFNFVEDTRPFHSKLDMAVFRGACYQEHRQEFVAKYHSSPLADVGDTDDLKKGQPGHRPYMSISDQLKYKFVVSLEGNDVATNLKWIMLSNSVCFMRKPKVESWFMEGSLIPEYHYVLLNDEFSDLEDKINYYAKHTDKAMAIIRNANQYAMQFLDTRREKLISLLVLKKYFDLSGQ